MTFNLFLNKGLMNYVDINRMTNHVLAINTRAAVGASIVWSIYEEGSETVFKTFTRTLTERNYYQELTFTEHNFKNATFYRIEGEVNGERVYTGKIYATDGVQAPSSHNQNRYQNKPNTNDYIILE